MLGILQRGPGFEGIGHQDLGLVVHACNVAALRDARGLATAVEALHQLLGGDPIQKQWLNRSALARGLGRWLGLSNTGGLRGCEAGNLSAIYAQGHVRIHKATRKPMQTPHVSPESPPRVLVAAVLDGVGLVPAAAREHAGPRPAAPVVRHDIGPALGSVQRPVHAAPVPDGKDVHLLARSK